MIMGNDTITITFAPMKPFDLSDSRLGMVSGGIDAKRGVRKFGNPEFLPIFVMSGAQSDRPGRFCFFSDSFPLSKYSGVYPAAFRNLWA